MFVPTPPPRLNYIAEEGVTPPAADKDVEAEGRGGGTSSVPPPMLSPSLPISRAAVAPHHSPLGVIRDRDAVEESRREVTL